MKIICVDAGNTLLKIAVADRGKITTVASFAAGDTEKQVRYASSLPDADACIVSSVGIVASELIKALSERAFCFFELTSETPIPIQNLYDTPETLGKDRLAAVVGAHGLFPGKNVLAVDAGTALTVDFINDAGQYLGGNISPGLQMRYRALHDYTQRLPLEKPVDDYPFLGSSTSSAIVSGVQTGMVAEIENYMNHFAERHPGLVTVMTGGDAFFFENKIKKPIFVESDLVFIGLTQIAEYNIKLKTVASDGA